ncbi:MAG: methyltransferase domain-containing protein [Planctomycetota bacterium]
MSATPPTTVPLPATATERRLVPEIMDDPSLDRALHEAALRGLGRINRVSRSAALMWPTIKAFNTPRRTQAEPLRVLDLACGGGDVLVALARRAAQASMNVRWIGADMSGVALDFARAQARDAGVEIDFEKIDVFTDALPQDLDLAMNSLFMHHLTSEQSVAVLKKMAAMAGAVLINDLRRGAVAHAFTVAGTRLITRSPVVHVDGPRSVRAAWTPDELRTLAEQAGLRGATVRRCFPWRMLLYWHRAMTDPRTDSSNRGGDR